MYHLRWIFFISVILASCSDNVKIKTVGKAKVDVSGGFKIESAANLAVRADYTLEWSMLAPNLSYGVIIASDQACRQVVTEKKDVTETKLDLSFLADGIYYLCVYGMNRSDKINASNNGIALTIDRTDPKITIPTDILSFSRAFDPPLQIQDLTDVSIIWSQISGPGQITFGKANSRFPQAVANKDGIYKIKAVITDKAGNRVEQIFQFNWDLSGPSVSIGSAVITSKAKSLDVVLDSSVVKTKWSFSGGPAGGVLNFVEGESPNAPLISASVEGTYKVILTAYDSAGNAGSASVDFTWDVTPPLFSSAALGGAAFDGFINSTERLLSITLIGSIDADGYDQIGYKLVSQGANCKQLSPYESSVPKSNNSAFAVDGGYKVCIELKDLAGNTSYGVSPLFVLDTAPATFGSVSLAFEAADGTITPADHLQSNNLISNIVAYDAYTKEYALVASSVSCSGPLSYAAAIPKTDDPRFVTTGSFKVCIRVTDQALNPSAYGESAAISYIAAGPVFTSLSGSSEAADGLINASEQASALAAWSLFASQYTTAAYTAPLNQSAAPVTCDASRSYSLSSIPSVQALTADAAWVICVKLSDATGGVVYGKSSLIVRDTIGPTFTSLAPAGDASDGFINDAEKASSQELWALTATDHVSQKYTHALSDAGGALVCGASQTYDQSSIPPVAQLTLDGSYGLCVKLLDSAGNPTYGKSAPIVRQTVPPTFTSLLGAHEAADGLVNAAEAASVQDLLVLTAAHFLTAQYSAPLDETSPVSCDGAQTYASSAIPKIFRSLPQCDVVSEFAPPYQFSEKGFSDKASSCSLAFKLSKYRCSRDAMVVSSIPERRRYVLMSSALLPSLNFSHIESYKKSKGI